MMTETTIKAHTRRSKNGTLVKVRGYTRRVGRKGVKSPKKSKDSPQPGEELVAKTQEAPKFPLVKMTNREADAWDKRAIELSLARYHKAREKREQRNRPAQRPTYTPPPRKKDIFERIEDKVAKFVERRTGKKYKRML